MRIAPRTTEEWFRSDRRSAIVLTIGAPVTALALAAVKLWVGPAMDWREVWTPAVGLACLIPFAWAQPYLSRRLNRRRDVTTAKERGADQIA